MEANNNMKNRRIKEQNSRSPGTPVDLELLSSRVQKLADLLEEVLKRESVQRGEVPAAADKKLYKAKA
jgi:hypothetical protein